MATFPLALAPPVEVPDLGAAFHPVLRTDAAAQPRRFLTLPEASAHVEARDSGAIGVVLVTNRADAGVFVRAATLFEGLGTQSRAAVEDVLVPAGATVGVRTRCVHMTHDIVQGATFRAQGDTTPIEVEKSLRAGQDRTWRSVAAYTKKTQALVGEPPMASDDLVSSRRRVRSRRNVVEDALARVPSVPGQVGLLTTRGGEVVAFEAFGDAASWRAYARDVARKHLEACLDQPPIAAAREPKALLALVHDLAAHDGEGAADGVTFAFHEGEVVRVGAY